MSTPAQLLFGNEQIFFTPTIPVEVRMLLNRATQQYGNPAEAERLLLAAMQLAPEQLETYIALYKFYFYQKRLDDAEAIALLALEKSAAQGEFDKDWTRLTPASADWGIHDGPQRVYLYTMKALGFIRLRQQDFSSAEAVLRCLEQLDPDDQVGGSVILDVAVGLMED